MGTRTRRLLTVSAAALVFVCSTGPATAEEPVSTEVTELPGVLVDELVQSEEQALTELTEGVGVRLEAFVVTPDGPEIITLEAGGRTDAAAAVELLEGQPSVEAADVSSPVRADAGGYRQYGNVQVRAAQARVELGGAGLDDVVVAVLDTGVARHPELAPALVAGRNFTDSPGGYFDTTDRYGHGTHVAGTIGADAGSDVEGVAAGVKIMPVKVLGDSGSGWSNWTADGIIWAADNGADVINMSLGGAEQSSVQAEAVAYARSKGVTVVAAAGNANTSVPQYPAAHPGVIGVAAVDESGAKAGFSNHGRSIDVAAPGVAIVSTYLPTRGGIAWLDGTSMAAPHVAGVAALIEAATPALTPDQVERALTATATDLGTSGRDNRFGHGRVDAVRAVQAAMVLASGGTVARRPAGSRITTAVPLAAGVELSWSAPADDGGAAITGYRVTASRGTTTIASVVVDGRTSAATITGLTNGTAYRIEVTARNSVGYGSLSAPVTATPRTTPGAPKLSSATARTQAIVVAWVEPASDGGAPVTGYVVQVLVAGKLIRAVPTKPTTTTLTVAGLSRTTSYTFRVVAKNAAGTGAVSAASKATRPR